MSTALVPYAMKYGPRAMSLARVYAKKRYGSNKAVKIVNKYGPAALRAAHVISKALRGSRARRFELNRSKRIPKGRTAPTVRNSSKKIATDPEAPPTTNGFGSLQILQLAWPQSDQATTSDNLIARERNQIHVKGIKVCHRFFGSWGQGGESDIGPMRVRWYMCQAKSGASSVTPNTAYNNNFFRTNNSGSNRSRNFNPSQGNITETYDFAKICAPVNPDETFRILTRRDFVIFPKTEGGVKDSRSLINEWKIEKYFKINKTLNFDATNSTLPKNEIFFLWWYYPTDIDQFDPLKYTNAYIKVQRHDILYYSERS